MDGQTAQTPENQASQAPVDPWLEAFASLESGNQDDTQADAGQADAEENKGEQDSSVDASNTDAASQSDNGQQADPAGINSGHDGVAGGESGGLGTNPELDDQASGTADGDMLGVSAEELEEYRAGLVEDVRAKAITDMANEFVKRGIRHTNGKLGATINDPDICKRDEDGTPRFFNPETGREFTGDNPRRQAQEWVDDYNKELAQAFNQACENYSAKLMEQDAPTIAVLEFAETYDKLDPIRKGMFDSIIQDYEIKDGNEIIGYTCDLNKALAAVDRQVQMIQGYYKANASNQANNNPTGPALDMKNSSGAIAPKSTEAPKSLEEAMLIQQNQLLESLKKGN